MLEIQAFRPEFNPPNPHKSWIWRCDRSTREPETDPGGSLVNLPSLVSESQIHHANPASKNEVELIEEGMQH